MDEKEKSFQARMQRWRHTGLLGKVKRAEIAMREIQQAPSARLISKVCAKQIEAMLEDLYSSLGTRSDQ